MNSPATNQTITRERPLRIALLTYRGKVTCGGQGVYVRHLSRELAALGHRVDVISGPPYPTVEPGVRLHRLPGLDLFAPPRPFRTPALGELRQTADWIEFLGMKRGGFAEPLAFSLRVHGYLRRHRAEFDLVHDNQGLGYGLLGVQHLGLPLLATIHHPIAIDHDLEAREADDARRAQLRRWYGFVHMQHRVSRRLPAILTVSAASKRAITERMHVPAGNIIVTPAGVDHRVFRPDPATTRIPGRIVTTASADVPLKGLTDLLHALAILRGRTAAHLVVVGTVRPGSPTNSLIDRLALTDDVSFRAGLSDAALADLLHTAQVACVPSRFEGFSLPALEAMACGTPLVTTTAGALPEVTGDAAVHVPAENPAALAAALGRVLGEPAIREQLTAAGVRRAGQYSWAATARTTAAAYSKLVHGAADRSHGAVTQC